MLLRIAFSLAYIHSLLGRVAGFHLSTFVPSRGTLTALALAFVATGGLLILLHDSFGLYWPVWRAFVWRHFCPAAHTGGAPGLAFVATGEPLITLLVVFDHDIHRAMKPITTASYLIAYTAAPAVVPGCTTLQKLCTTYFSWCCQPV